VLRWVRAQRNGRRRRRFIPSRLVCARFERAEIAKTSSVQPFHERGN
jgi:hypothetical protein